MKRKNGFTLTEILVVIAIIGILLTIVMPNITNIFKGSVKNTMKITETELSDAGTLYLEDHCKNKLDGYICPETITQNTDYTYSGHVTLETLIQKDYIDEITLQGSNCNGCVIFSKNKAKSYLTCENDTYKTETDIDFETICGI